MRLPVPSLLVILILCCTEALALPTICSVVNTAAFSSCLQFSYTTTTCPYPPRPCAYFSYYVPQYYIEVVSNPRETFFAAMPAASGQLAAVKDFVPFAAEDDEGAFSYHAHVIPVPFVSTSFGFLPCGGAPTELTCFSAMSEHLGRLWRTGEADLSQPLFLAWSAAPKACLLTGAALSVTGTSSASGYPTFPYCSVDHSSMTTFPPSGQSVCTGWGIHFPRYGTVTNADQTTASLVIASRIKSLGAEVFQTVAAGANEKWQMIYPQGSACFREGQNVGILRPRQVTEVGRLTKGLPKSYLYVIWKHVSCLKEASSIATAQLGRQAMQAACKGME